MPLYEVAILEMPEPKQAAEFGATEKLVVKPEFVVAKDPQQAAMKVAMAKRDVEINFDRMSVLVRPFA